MSDFFIENIFLLVAQILHHRTYVGKDWFNTKTVGVRNAKKSRNTPGI